MEEPFIKDAGIFFLTLCLILVTIWYVIATMFMGKIMYREYQLKALPKLGFKGLIINSNTWDGITLQQEIVNIGISYCIIENAILQWNTTHSDFKEQEYIVSSESYPIVLSPGNSIILSFEMSSVVLQSFYNPNFEVPSYLLSGVIRYQCKGIDNKEHLFWQTVPFTQQ